jgi:hypothetical protein
MLEMPTSSKPQQCRCIITDFSNVLFVNSSKFEMDGRWRQHDSDPHNFTEVDALNARKAAA